MCLRATFSDFESWTRVTPQSAFRTPHFPFVIRKYQEIRGNTGNFFRKWPCRRRAADLRGRALDCGGTTPLSVGRHVAHPASRNLHHASLPFPSVSSAQSVVNSGFPSAVVSESAGNSLRNLTAYGSRLLTKNKQKAHEYPCH